VGERSAQVDAHIYGLGVRIQKFAVLAHSNGIVSPLLRFDRLLEKFLRARLLSPDAASVKSPQGQTECNGNTGDPRGTKCSKH
jgi:hypothetical protein